MAFFAGRAFAVNSRPHTMHISLKNKSSPILTDFARTPLYTKKVSLTPSRIRLRARMRVESVLT